MFRKNSTAISPVPVFHCTDLFRPHGDPDDHYDLACQFALANAGLTDLQGILIDYPPKDNLCPDIVAVAQLNQICGKAVPVGVGGKRGDNGIPGGLSLLKKVLTEAKQPVAIHMVGGCEDIARAATLWGELFAEKVAAIYLNAGAGISTETLEYNVSINPHAYSRIFSIPCPIYWMPCFHDRDKSCIQGEFGTFYNFKQSDLFSSLSPELLNYFTGMLDRHECSHFLQELNKTPDPETVRKFGEMRRNMWCTAGFLHMAGLTVSDEGEILTENECKDPVFRFDQISVSCSSDGRTNWKPGKAAGFPPRYIFHITDEENYARAMTCALKEMLGTL